MHVSTRISFTAEHEQELIQEAIQANPAFGRALDYELPFVIMRFARSSKDYGDGAQKLGLKGQFADINRKVLKLERALWDDVPLVGEPIEVVLQDLIAHCLLTLDMLARHPVKENPAELVASSDWCNNPSCIIHGPHTKASHGVSR
jgi:hypothetical protein